MLLHIIVYCPVCCSNYILYILIITLSFKETMGSALQTISNGNTTLLSNKFRRPKSRKKQIKHRGIRLKMIRKTLDWNLPQNETNPN